MICILFRNFKIIKSSMSFYQIFTIANRLRQQAIDKTLTLEIFFNTPIGPTIARQNNEYITHFLIDHIKEIIEIAIGEKAGAPPNIVNTAMELLLFPSISLLEFLSKNEIIMNHIISRMINQEEVNVFFINTVKILIFIITSSNGTILNQIKDQTLFLKQILTLNTSKILDDLLFTILNQETKFVKWINPYEYPPLIDNLLKLPSYSANYNRIIIFHRKLLTIFQNQIPIVEGLESRSICESLVNIGLNFFCLNALKTINFIIGKDTITSDDKKEKLEGLLAIIDQTMNCYITLLTESKQNDKYFFGPVQKESLSIISYYIMRGNWPIEKVAWAFNLANFLWEQFLFNPTNSFLHNSFYFYFCQIAKYEENFIGFILNAGFLQKIPEIFFNQENIPASFFGQLLEISRIIIDKDNGSFVAQAQWFHFVDECYSEKNNILEKKYLYAKPPKQPYYKEQSDQILRDILDKDLIDNEVSSHSDLIFDDDYTSSEYVLYEEEEEEEEFMEDRDDQGN